MRTRIAAARMSSAGISLTSYVVALCVVFVVPIVVILLGRRFGWAKLINLRALLLRSPLKGRMKALMLQNNELSKRPMNQQLETFLYSR